jgi:hypothetical protein
MEKLYLLNKQYPSFVLPSTSRRLTKGRTGGVKGGEGRLPKTDYLFPRVKEVRGNAVKSV